MTPAAVVVGVGTLRHRGWARRPLYALIGGYALLGASVAGMATIMYVKDDPDASLVAASVLLSLAGYLYHPLLRRGPRPTMSEAGRQDRHLVRR